MIQSRTMMHNGNNKASESDFPNTCEPPVKVRPGPAQLVESLARSHQADSARQCRSVADFREHFVRQVIQTARQRLGLRHRSAQMLHTASGKTKLAPSQSPAVSGFSSSQFFLADPWAAGPSRAKS